MLDIEHLSQDKNSVISTKNKLFLEINFNVRNINALKIFIAVNIYQIK